VKHIAVLVFASFVIAGCQILPEASRIDLYESKWSVTSLGDEQLGGRVELNFNPRGVDEVAELSTPCAVTEFGFSMDTDGSIIQFGGPKRTVERTCSSVDQDLDARLAEALIDVTHWSIQDQQHITLGGPTTVSLAR